MINERKSNMVNTYNVYLLNGQIVEANQWTAELDECISAVQAKTPSSATKQAIRTAIVSDINSGRTSVVNGHEFSKLVKVVVS